MMMMMKAKLKHRKAKNNEERHVVNKNAAKLCYTRKEKVGYWRYSKPSQVAIRKEN